jgi:hypothetical protein
MSLHTYPAFISAPARRRSQQRGKRREALALVYRHGDRERLAGRSRRAISLSHRACRELIADGLAPALVERAKRIELIVAADDHVVTVLNSLR